MLLRGCFFLSSPCVSHFSQPRALRRVLLSPKTHQRELLYFRNGIARVKTSRDPGRWPSLYLSG